MQAAGQVEELFSNLTVHSFFFGDFLMNNLYRQ